MTMVLFTLLYSISVLGLIWVAGITLQSTVLLFGYSLGFYSMLVLIDVWSTLRFLQRSLCCRRSRNRSLNQPSAARTVAGKLLEPYVSAVLYELVTQETSIYSERVKAALSISKPVLPLASAPENKLEAALESICREFSCCSIAIIKNTKAAELDISVQGICDRRFRKVLSEYITTYYICNNKEIFGVYDTIRNKAQLRAFSAFGVYSFFCFPIVCENEDTQVLCWAGYTAEAWRVEVERCEALRVTATRLYHSHESSKQLQRLEERAVHAEHQERSASEFITHLSHDIRSPLNNIKASLSLLKTEHIDCTDELFVIAKKNCDVLEDMVEGILDFNRYAAGSLSVVSEAFDVCELLCELCEAYSLSARQKTLALTFEKPENTSPIIADRRQVRRIFSNIISNAIKYTETGSITVSLSMQSAQLICIRVEDTGCGMSGEQLGLLFQPFQRFSNTEEGIGLGLTVTKILTELNAGSISVQSEPGSGTYVELSFPLAQNIVEKFSLPHSKDSAGYLTSNHVPRVVLVDDDEDLLLTVKRSLRYYAVEVLVATTVSDAVAICNFGLPDLVITDDSMPGGGGTKVVSFLQRAACTAPVIVLTGSSEAVVQERYAVFTSVIIIQKPVDANSLRMQMEELLGGMLEPLPAANAA